MSDVSSFPVRSEILGLGSSSSAAAAVPEPVVESLDVGGEADDEHEVFYACPAREKHITQYECKTCGYGSWLRDRG